MTSLYCNAKRALHRRTRTNGSYHASSSSLLESQWAAVAPCDALAPLATASTPEDQPEWCMFEFVVRAITHFHATHLRYRAATGSACTLDSQGETRLQPSQLLQLLLTPAPAPAQCALVHIRLRILSMWMIGWSSSLLVSR